MRENARRRRRAAELFRARDVLTAVTLVVALFVAYKTWDAANRSAAEALQTAFDMRVQESDESILRRLAVYEQALRSTLALFSTVREVKREDFRNFVGTLSISEAYPGVQSVGWSALVPAADKERHIATVRAEGLPNYTIWPEGQRDPYSAIVYVEPATDENVRALGFDMYSDATRRQAMEYARDTGRAAMTGKVSLIGRSAEARPRIGFVMYLPVYRSGTARLALEERRGLAGWVYAPVEMADFMAGLFGDRIDGLDLEIYDGAKADPSALLFRSGPTQTDTQSKGKRSVVSKEVGGRVWTIVTAFQPAFEQHLQSDRPQLILQAGISISLMLALLMWLFLDDRGRTLQAAEQARQLALYDGLTGLPNRNLLEERLERALTQARRHHGNDHDLVAVLFIDLDKFKPVNDNYGHDYGDQLLKEVALRLESCMRESDSAARIGGDEFVALLQEVNDKTDVSVVANKILDTLNQPYEIGPHRFEISASIGAALYPEHGEDGKTLIKSADSAMYGAKHRGRANVQFA